MAPFGQPVGPTMPLPQTAVGIFQQFFTTSLIQLIVTETNNYAAQVLGYDVGVKWTDVNDNDIWALLGFAVLMGINWLHQLCMYWSQQYRFLPIAERIPRDRFMDIWQ